MERKLKMVEKLLEMKNLKISQKRNFFLYIQIVN